MFCIQNLLIRNVMALNFKTLECWKLKAIDNWKSEFSSDFQ